MSFVFATSHLPTLKRPDPSGARQPAMAARRANAVSQQEQEEEQEDVQPMLHGGGVRALSHLPEAGRRDDAMPRPSAPAHLPSWITEAPEAGHELEAETDADSHGDFEPPEHAEQRQSGDPDGFSGYSHSDTPGTSYADTPPETSERDEADAQRGDSWDNHPPQPRPDAATSTPGRLFEKRSTPEAFFTQQGLSASGAASQQRQQKSQEASAAPLQQVRASNPPAKGGSAAQPQAPAQAQRPAAGPAQNAPAAPPPQKQGLPPAPQKAADAGQSTAKEPAPQQQMKIDASNPQFEAAARAALADEAANSPTAAALQKEADRLGIAIVPQKGLAMSETKLVDGKPVIHFNPNPLMKTDTTMSHEITHAIQTAAYQQFISDAKKAGKTIDQTVLDAATKAGQDAVAKIVPVHSIKDTPNDRRENEAMRMANVVNAERTASEMKNLPEDQKTVEEFQRRQTEKEKARGEPEKGRKHPNNTHPMPEGTERGNYNNQYVRDTLGLDEKGRKKPKPPSAPQTKP